MTHALSLLTPAAPARPMHVLDVGCGNGRLLQALAEALPPGAVAEYQGIEPSAPLRAHAAAAAAAAPFPAAVCTGDLLLQGLGLPMGAQRPGGFDLVACFTVLHHLPSDALRRQAFRQLAAALAPAGRLLVSVWQFSHSARLRARVAPWSAIGLIDADVDAGDALLPWDQGVHALRYVHEFSRASLQAAAAQAGLALQSTFSADGREGNLSLYAVFVHQEPLSP